MELEILQQWIIFKKTCIQNSTDKAGTELDREKEQAYKRLWRCFAPRRVQVTKILQKRIPTKKGLQNRGIISSNDDITCSMCGGNEENVEQIFFLCSLLQVKSGIIVTVGRNYQWFEILILLVIFFNMIVFRFIF